jgi:hypothetical protein
MVARCWNLMASETLRETIVDLEPYTWCPTNGRLKPGTSREPAESQAARPSKSLAVQPLLHRSTQTIRTGMQK